MVLPTKLFLNVPNQKIFCNTPWYETHIYWDGSLGICCQEQNKLYSSTDTQYNIASMRLMEWFNSQPVKDFRLDVLGDKAVSVCSKCTRDQHYGHDSRRLKSNQKSAIFTKTAFEPSWHQSPGHAHFEHSINNGGATTSYPIDLHIDLGNYCNLACKMCHAEASSTIAGQEVKWGIESSRPFLGQDWTRDPVVWESFKQQLLEIPDLNQIHFMGGETLLTPRFEDLVDFFIKHKRFDQCFSFVSNGTVYKPDLMVKLSKFKRVGIEISIESLGPQNAYVRQGTNTATVLKNIELYKSWCNESSITVTIRTAPGALSIGTYTKLLHYCLQNKFIVKSNMVHKPKYLDIVVLPDNIKLLYLREFDQLLKELTAVDITTDFNASDPNNVLLVIKDQVIQCRAALCSPQPDNVDQLLNQLVQHCKKWDQIYNLNARTVYPELKEIWDKYGY